MNISLVIPAHNEETLIGPCLEHAIKNSRGAFSEVIVVDNASTDRTAEIAHAYPGVKVVREEKKGLTHARQRGLEESTGELVAYIDSDTRLPERWTTIAEKVFTERPDVVCLSGPYKYYDGSPLLRFGMAVAWWLSGPITYHLVGYMVLGGNFIARRSALLKMGGFDKNIAFYGEDTNIARRLHQFGKVLFRMDFFIYTSLRRISGEGFLRTNARYAINYLWEVFFHRPYTKNYNDIRK